MIFPQVKIHVYFFNLKKYAMFIVPKRSPCNYTWFLDWSFNIKTRTHAVLQKIFIAAFELCLSFGNGTAGKYSQLFCECKTAAWCKPFFSAPSFFIKILYGKSDCLYKVCFQGWSMRRMHYSEMFWYRHSITFKIRHHEHIQKVFIAAFLLCLFVGKSATGKYS